MEHRTMLTSLIKFLAFQPMKNMITRFLVSISIFSLVLSYSFSYYQYLNYFSSNYFHLILGRAMNKNYIFFICNGLLVFLAKTSGFVLSPPSSGFDPNELLQKRIGDGLETDIHEIESGSLLEKDCVTLMEESCEISEDQEQEQEQEHEQEHEHEHEPEQECLDQRAEDEVSIFIPDSDEESGEKNDENGYEDCWLFHDEDQHEEEQEEEDGKQEKLEMLSTEELNKKFEDFIRKMKEEIRISEVRQQLLMVN